MLAYDNFWSSSSVPVVFEVEPRCQYSIDVSCTEVCHLHGRLIDGETWTLLYSGPSFHIKPKFEGFAELQLSCAKPKTEFGYRLVQIRRRLADPVTDEDPPAPPMPKADNLVLHLARMVRDQARARSGPTMDPEDVPTMYDYTVDDDDLGFEEETYQRMAAAHQRARDSIASEDGDQALSSDPQQNTAQATSQRRSGSQAAKSGSAGGAGASDSPGDD